MRHNMRKNEIILVLEDWNLWKRDLDTGIKRIQYLDKLIKFLDQFPKNCIL